MVKLKVGKYYKSRDGRKWKCVHESSDSNPFFNMLCVLIDNSLRINYYFSKDGRYEDHPEPYDLISEWVEPVEHEVYVYAYRDGDTIMLRTKPIEELKPIAVVPFKFTEGDGL